MNLSNSTLTTTEKYELYEGSVQCPESDIDFLNQVFLEARGRQPLSLREDFCGTALLAVKWVEQGPSHESFGIDLDIEPLAYGKSTHLTTLTHADQKRVHLIEGNVLDSYPFMVDVHVAFNFSYFIFKERSLLLSYFKKVKESLPVDGIFVLDLFGGTDCGVPQMESRKLEKHIYYWECKEFNPLNSHCTYAIHFKKNRAKERYENVFLYDWRLWTHAELADLLLEAGFHTIKKYWEGETPEGEGDGIFYPAELATNCSSWVSYIVAY